MNFIGHVQPKLALFEFTDEKEMQDRTALARAALFEEASKTANILSVVDIECSAGRCVVGIFYITNFDLGL